MSAFYRESAQGVFLVMVKQPSYEDDRALVFTEVMTAGRSNADSGCFDEKEWRTHFEMPLGSHPSIVAKNEKGRWSSEASRVARSKFMGFRLFGDQVRRSARCLVAGCLSKWPWNFDTLSATNQGSLKPDVDNPPCTAVSRE